LGRSSGVGHPAESRSDLHGVSLSSRRERACKTATRPLSAVSACRLETEKGPEVGVGKSYAREHGCLEKGRALRSAALHAAGARSMPRAKPPGVSRPSPVLQVRSPASLKSPGSSPAVVSSAWAFRAMQVREGFGRVVPSGGPRLQCAVFSGCAGPGATAPCGHPRGCALPWAHGREERCFHEGGEVV